LFRIDRRLVNLAGTKVIKLGADENQEVGAEGEGEVDYPDAAASAEALAYEYLSSAEREAKEKTEALIEKAQIEAEQIIRDAHDEAEEIFKRAKQEGFDEGSVEGKRSYDKKLAEKIQEDDEMLRNVLDEISEERERVFSEMEDEIAHLALEIVRKIIHPPLEEIGDIFTPLIKNALRQMSTDGKIIIRVGPTEYERFFSSGAAVIELDSGVTVTATVLRDLALEEGDCIIDTEDVTVNAGIASQLNFVKISFERANQYEPD